MQPTAPEWSTPRAAGVVAPSPPATGVTQDPGALGRSSLRHEDERLLRGSGSFVDDHDPPRVLHMAVARSPFPRARILSINVSAAWELDSVRGVLLGRDLRARTGPLTIVRPVPDAPEIVFYALADDEVLFEGQPVLSLVATDRYTAEDALDLVDIEYEPLPYVSDVDSALADDAPVLHEDVGSNLLVENVRSMGDAEAVSSTAEVVVEGAVQINRVTGLPMETRGVVAEFNAGLGTLDVVASTQTPHIVRHQLADCLRVREADISVRASDVGGAFGLKIGLFAEEALACRHAMDLNRPVKWIEDRNEHFRSSTHGREAKHEIQIAGRKDGTIEALKNVYSVDLGAFNSPTGSPMLSSLMFQGPYRITDGLVKRRVVITNKTPVGAYRGYGQPESAFARETLVDLFAREVGMDPVKVRLKNFVQPDDMPWETPGGAKYDSGDYAACLEKAVELVGYEQVRSEQEQHQGHNGRYQGVGVACYVEMTGYPGSRFLGKHGAMYGAHEGVVLRANRSGGMDLFTGVSSFGQSTETTFAQLAAGILGLPHDEVRVHSGDSTWSPTNTGSFASRTLIAGSGAIQKAALEIQSKAFRIAAHLLDVNVEDLRQVDGRIYCIDDPDTAISFATVANEAATGHRLPEGEDPGLEATAYFDPPASTFAYGSSAAVVEVDAMTGQFEIKRFVFVHDCGTQVNPMLVEGQLRGGIAQALGAALSEELVYDPDTGQLINGSMLDYFAPTAADLPEVDLDHTEVPSPVTPFGVRGVGESGTIPPSAAIANAVSDALATFGVVVDWLPITPESVWRAVQQASRRIG